MRDKTDAYLVKLNKSNMIRSNARQIILLLSFLVVLSVFWGLKLTGITMAGEAFCGQEEHVHNEECMTSELICELGESEIHIHSESCILKKLKCGQEEQEPHHHDDACKVKTLICEIEEKEAHTHSDECVNRTLSCALEEVEGHTHSDDCINRTLDCTLEEVEGHTHSEECANRILGCALEEVEGHTHSDNCIDRTLACTLEEIEGHTHSDSCYVRELTCTTEEVEGHEHGSSCYEEYITCELEEGEEHTHDESCKKQELVCDLEEIEGHSHDEDCYETSLCCELEEVEGHSHDESCYIDEGYTCGLEEIEGHAHDESCYIDDGYSCGLEEMEGHAHNETCYTEDGYCCGLEEIEGHAHSDACYIEEDGYICGREETEGHTHGDECYIIEEDAFACGREETEGHVHTEDCWYIGTGFGCGLLEADGHVHTQECVTEDTELGCGLEYNEGHEHTEECYGTVKTCPYEEHIHDVTCYSNMEADLETEDDWEIILAGLTRSFDTAENIVSVARSQLGYEESVLNFEVDEHRVRRGITRYGQWYGNPYGDWSAMFASFCLHYAGVEDAPANAGPESMRLEWDEIGRYADADSFTPKVGNLLFLHKENQTRTIIKETANPSDITLASASSADDRLLREATNATPSNTGMRWEEEIVVVTDFDEDTIRANAVAIITEIDGDTVTVIEGDLNDTVAETTYSLDDPALMGYGLIESRPPLMMMAAAPKSANVIAETENYNQSMFTNGRYFVVYTQSGENCYAFDGNGNAVPIYIDDEGNILSDHENPDALYWTFTRTNNNTYVVQNVYTGQYMHAYTNNGGGVTTVGQNTSTLNAVSNGVRIRGNSAYAALNTSTETFGAVSNANQAAVFQFGVVDTYTVWFDGTQGGLATLGDADNRSYTVPAGVMVLPTEWKSNSEYNYILQGWYDVINHKYYAPGAEVTVTGNMVFYADWVASTYDFGQFNAYTVNTVSTNDFITTRVFDYGTLFNVLSSTVNVNVSADSHRETWSLLTSGNNPYNGEETLAYIFRTWDPNGDIAYPNNTNDNNTFVDGTPIHYGLYSSRLENVLFDTDNSFNPENGTGIIGKTYLGTADHLFQFEDDPESEYYGYYYYDSELNAASYSQSDNRFYIYDYLEQTTDSSTTTDEGKYTDFLPFNSPYVKPNGNTPATYSYDGKYGEYAGETHYMYDAGSNDSSDVVANYHFGMSMDVNFYLPNDVGSGLNQDLYGNDMHFRFSGDDDVWVLVDGKLVLDLGGIHGVESGDINFSSGEVMINGVVNNELSATLKSVQAGEHTMTFYYLERGSSMSNCAIFFNLAPRFSFTIQKEDFLTRYVLNGAQFSVYMDQDCTEPAELWPSKASHDAGNPSTNEFTVVDGVAAMWGMGASNTYYIKETKPPDNEDYGFPDGLIQLQFDKTGAATYKVIILDVGDGISGGFTVHGFRIDEETQEAYIIATNAPNWVKEETSVEVRKLWNDTKEHSGEKIVVYLTVTDPDGTVRRLQEVELEDGNGWAHKWENLPKYWEDGETEIQYGVEEAYISGYYNKVELVDSYNSTTTNWETVSKFENGETYILGTKNGYLSTLQRANDTGYKWVSQDEAKESELALWTTTVNGQTVKFTNGAGQTITFYYANGSPTDFFAKTGGETNEAKQYFTYVNGGNNGIRIYYDAPNGTDYYLADSMNSSQKFNYNTNANNGLYFTPMKEVTKTIQGTVEGWGYLVTNTPLDQETSVTVHKYWDYGYLNPSGVHETAQVTVRLLADGKDTGRTVTLSLKNGWEDTFRGLPYVDSNDKVIEYSIVESWDTDDWIPEYGEVITSGGTIPTYDTTITNKYRKGMGGPELPSTGTAARLLYILCGSSILLATLVYGIGLRRKRERRKE